MARAKYGPQLTNEEMIYVLLRMLGGPRNKAIERRIAKRFLNYLVKVKVIDINKFKK